MSKIVERRDLPVTLRIREKDGGNGTAVGHAMTFSQPYDLGTFWEQVHPNAADRVLEEGADVLAFWNHDTSLVLGRTTATPPTLRLSKDDTGLAYEIDLPNSAVREREAMARGDVRASSFAFYTLDEEWDEEGGPDGRPLRTLLDMDIFEFSPTPLPANPNTDVGMRRLQEHRSQHTKPEEPKVLPDFARLELVKRK